MHKVVHTLKRRIESLKYRSSLDVLSTLLGDKAVRELYPDGITLVDMLPRRRLKIIAKAYQHESQQPDFDVATFINVNFLPIIYQESYKTDKTHTPAQHIERLWQVMWRSEKKNKGSLIGLPHPYVVSGGRFRSVFYWDSYFIALGLAVSGHWGLIEDMAKNFAFLLRRYRRILTGNRTYFKSRSQPPVFSLIIRLLATHKGNRALALFLPYLLLEYRFWMKGARNLKDGTIKRVVRMPEGEILNRYFDDNDTPRPESYREDIETANQADSKIKAKIYRSIRAAAESGWDFSARWLRDDQNISTIRTIEIIPVDLNCLLYELETTIADAYKHLRQKRLSKLFLRRAENRAKAINKYFWDEKHKFYFDFDLTAKRPCVVYSAAGMFPLFSRIASKDQAKRATRALKKMLLKPGGVVCTNILTNQQWDAPNGWAPLQWITVKALRNYQFDDLANQIKARWQKNVEQWFRASGRLFEKYNVVDIKKPSGGGEYVLQEGFGWTNGIYLAFLHEDELHYR